MREEDENMCSLCPDHLSNTEAHRIRVLQLLALIEHPNALPTDAVLRIGNELLAWLGQAEAKAKSARVAAPGIETGHAA